FPCGSWECVAVLPSDLILCIQEATLKSLGDGVLVKINVVEDTIAGGIMLPTTTQSKPRGVEVVAVGEGTTIVLKWVEVDVKTDTPALYSKYAGTEVEFNGAKHLLLKEDDIVGILETLHMKDLKPPIQGLISEVMV
ncbi:20 kDa chaperonin, chloroplastic-like protein, partial [Tanacetum coccineum]